MKMGSTPEHLEQLAMALEDLASSIRRDAELMRAGSGSVTVPDHFTALGRAKRLHPQMGERQEQVLGVVAAAQPDGTDTGKISRQIGYDQSNVYLTLHSLMRRRFISKDTSTDPHTYRLGRELTDG